VQSVAEREALREAQKAFDHRGPPWYFAPVRALARLFDTSSRHPKTLAPVTDRR
jgi:hypothetical protein